MQAGDFLLFLAEFRWEEASVLPWDAAPKGGNSSGRKQPEVAFLDAVGASPKSPVISVPWEAGRPSAVHPSCV
jgi:hypothetical protein